MKAELKGLHSPDIDNLENYKPLDDNNFGFLLQVLVGIKGENSEESFDAIVCTPKWIELNYNKNDVILGENFIIMFQYNYKKLFNIISDLINNIEEENWDRIANKLDRIGKWEFREYYEPK